MAEPRCCIFCQRPLPRRHWWQLTQLVNPPPPFCLDLTSTCRTLWEQRIGKRDVWWRDA